MIVVVVVVVAAAAASVEQKISTHQERLFRFFSELLACTLSNTPLPFFSTTKWRLSCGSN